MSNKIYTERLTNTFCGVTRQLYIDKITQKAQKPMDEELLKDLEKFEDKLIDAYEYINDIFSRAIRKNELRLDFNDLYNCNYESMAMEVYTTMLDVTKVDMLDLLADGMNLEMIGDKKSTKIELTQNMQPIILRNIENENFVKDSFVR